MMYDDLPIKNGDVNHSYVNITIGYIESDDVNRYGDLFLSWLVLQPQNLCFGTWKYGDIQWINYEI